MNEERDTDHRIREIEGEINAYPLSLKMCEEDRSIAIWYSLFVHEERCYDVMQRSDGEDRLLAITRDKSKFALRNVLNWLDTCDSNSYVCRQPLRINQRRHRLAQELFRLGLDYDGIVVSYVYYTRGIGTTELVDQNTVRFLGDMEELRLDVLERLRKSDESRAAIEQMRKFHHDNPKLQDAAQRVQTNCRPGSGDAIEVHYDPESLEPLFELHRAMLQRLFLFPSDWSFRSISISVFRAVWCALSVMASLHILAHLASFHPRIYPKGLCSVVPTKSRRSWVADIVALCPQITAEEVGDIVDLLTYSPRLPTRRRDPGLQPFVELAHNTLGICPHLIDGSSHERNLMALLAKRFPDEYSATTGVLENALITQLGSIVENCGFAVARRVRIPGKAHLPDIDLAAFDESEGLLLIAELKWVIAPADVDEKFFRADQEEKGIAQVAKLLEFERNNRGEILKACFPQRDIRCSRTVGHVVIRGFDGTAFNRDPEIPVVEESIFRRKIESGVTLSGLDSWLRGRQFLPVAGRDFEVRSQSLKFGKNTVIADGYVVHANGVPGLNA